MCESFDVASSKMSIVLTANLKMLTLITSKTTVLYNKTSPLVVAMHTDI